MREPALPTFRAVEVGGRAEIDFGRAAQRFAQRGMRMDGFGQVAGRGAHFDGQHGLGDQLARPGADDAAAQQAARFPDR